MGRMASIVTPVLLLLLPPPALPQSTTYGSLVGVVRDTQGGVVSGTRVTLYGEPVMGESVVLTELDGSYLFRALAPGTYNLRFEMPGFSILDRLGIIVTTGTTITIDATLELAGVVESLIVTGESPTVDVKMTRVGATFNEFALHDIPSATDVWAVLAQSPGVRMRGYDVGGSHKSQQTYYESFGIREQNRVISDGVDSTEGSGGTGFYYDYYSMEEFQVSAGGADVEMTSPGASLVMTIKSGGNELSGLFHVDYEGERFVGDNSDKELEERGYTGNPNLLLWEAHADIGGPIVGDKAWFFGGYNHFHIDKVISGTDPKVATDIGIFDNIVSKLTFKLSEKDRLIGYSQWGLKQKPHQGLSLLSPQESTVDQDSWSWVHKAEWQRIWSSRTFSNVQVKHFGFRSDFEAHSDYRTNPRHVDTATGSISGANIFTPSFIRFKPQISAQMSYYLPAKTGSHDLKLGFWWQVDSSQIVEASSESPNGAIFYRDNSLLGRPNNVDEIRVFNKGPGGSDDRNTSLHFFLQDTWSPTSRWTLTMGIRLTRQHAYYMESELNPILSEFFPTGTVPGRSLVTWFNAAPRLGASFDLAGKRKTVLKAYYGRYYINIADSLRSANPTGLQFKQYDFLDPNLNGLFDGPHELGSLVFQTSAAGGTPVNPDLKPSFADETSLSLEHELKADTAVRLSYVHKTLKNAYGEWNQAQVLPLESSGIPCGDEVFPCPLDPYTGESLQVARVPDEAAGAQDVLIDTFPFSTSSYDTLQVAFSRRFNRRFFIQGSFDYQWRDELRSALGEDRTPLVVDPIAVEFWQNHSLDVSHLQTNTNWQAKVLGRYVFPGDLATSLNLRYQSGWPWAPIHRVRIPGSGTQPIFLENIENNRSENVTLLDIRLEKSFMVKERHRLTGMLDAYNLFNSNAETNFVLRTGGIFRNIIAALDPRTLKIGFRWQF